MSIPEEYELSDCELLLSNEQFGLIGEISFYEILFGTSLNVDKHPGRSGFSVLHSTIRIISP